jgi:hypothetical protein
MGINKKYSMCALLFCRILRKGIILRPNFEEYNTELDY